MRTVCAARPAIGPTPAPRVKMCTQLCVYLYVSICVSFFVLACVCVCMCVCMCVCAYVSVCCVCVRVCVVCVHVQTTTCHQSITCTPREVSVRAVKTNHFCACMHVTQVRCWRVHPRWRVVDFLCNARYLFNFTLPGKTRSLYFRPG